MTATYTVLTRPRVDGGRLVWLRLRLDNTGDHRLSGVTAGLLELTDTATVRRRVLDWGGSSADGIAVRPRATSTRRILNVVGRPVPAGRGARVSLLGVATALRAPGAPRDCALPARMRAPSGLVAGHPDGSWFLTARQGERIRVRGLRRNL